MQDMVVATHLPRQAWSLSQGYFAWEVGGGTFGSCKEEIMQASIRFKEGQEKLRGRQQAARGWPSSAYKQERAAGPVSAVWLCCKMSEPEGTTRQTHAWAITGHA